MIAAVGAFVEPTFTRAAYYRPRLSFEMRHPGVNHIRVPRLKLYIHRSNALGYEQNLLPRNAAVCSFEHAALGVRLERISHNCHPDDVWLGRVDSNGADLSSIVKTDELPGLPGVSTFIHSPSGRHIAADTVRSGASINSAGVGLGNNDAAR